MASSLGFGFRPIQIDTSNCDVVIQYVPVIGTYNKLVLDSQNFDSNNATSVRTFYEDAFMLSSDLIIFNDAIAYHVAFATTGELNDALGLATLRSVCGDECYSVVLSGIHWSIRLYMNQFLCKFDNYAAHYIPIPVESC